MKSKNSLIISVFLLGLGLLSIVSFVVIMADGENILKWIAALILSVVFVALGVKGIIDHTSRKG